MGKFDGILLCTDFDSTLAVKEQVSQENCDAIRYFQENGGKFTIVSGRHPFFLKEHLEGFAVNAPLVGYNGAYIIDCDSGETVYSGGRQDFTALEVAEHFWNTDERLRRVVVHDRTRNNFRCSRAPLPELNRDFKTLRAQAELPLYNMLLSTKEEEEAIALRDAIRAYVGNSFEVCRSWGIGIEIICPNDTKGMAALRLKDLLHAKLLVAAGDYENDIPMIRAADIGYAVENATDEVKSAADRLTVDCKEHAIAAIIRELEESL